VFRAKNLAAEHRDEVTVYLLEEAARLDPGHARTHFTLANALLAVGENDRAQAAFARARDLDRLRFRADTRTLDTITEIARERNVPLIDTPEFAREAHPSGIVGEELLLEHVHPNLEGHYAIARALFRPVVSQLADTGRLRSESNMTDAPALEVCTDRLGLTPAWITHAGRSALQTIASRPPFTPEWQEEALARWETRAGSIPDVLGAHATTDALAEALERHPEDLLAREALAGALAREDRGTESTQQLQSIIDAYPDWAWVRTRLARFRLAEGEHERAAQDASASLNVHPGDVEAWGVLAHALAAGDRLAEAIEAATRAVELAPERADTHFQIGRLLVRAERFEQAEDKLRVALKRSPDHPLALQQLARLAARDGRTTEAFNLAMLAARSAPNSVEILVDATRFALDAGRLEAARRSWQSATKLESDLSRRFAGLAERVSRRARRVAPRPQNQ
jgi:tetratricopeptide (TPR) repeat protein